MSHNSAHILIVNDSPSEVDYITSILSKEGHTVSNAASKRDALLLLKKTPFDLIITDIVLNDVSDIEHIAEFKMQKVNAHSPIICYTGYNNPEIIEKAFTSGAIDFINKSANKSELLTRIEVRLIEANKQKNIHQKLKKSEQRFKTMLDFTYDIEFFRNAEGQIEYVSPSIERILGITPDEYKSGEYSFDKIIHEDDREKALTDFKKALQGESIFDTVFRFRHKKGHYVFGAVTAQAVYDKDNSFIGFRTSLRDVSNQMVLSTKIKNSEERYKSLFEKTPAVVLIIDPEKKIIIDVNEAAINFYGYKKKDIINKSVTFINVSPEAKIHDKINQVSNGLISTLIFNHKTASGEIKTVSVNSSPFFLQERKYLYSIVQDITDKIKTEKALEIKNKELIEANKANIIEKDRIKMIFDNVMDAIISINKRGNIEMFNKSAQMLFGYKSEEVVGKNIKILTPINYKNKHDSYIKNYLNTGHKKIIGKTREVEAQRKDGSIFPAELRVEEANIGNEIRFIAVIRDISDQIKRRQELIDNEQKFRAFFNNSNDAIYLFGINNGEPTKFVEVNEVATKMLGYTREEFLNMYPYDLNAPSSEINKHQLISETDKKGSALFTLYHCTKDKQEIPVEAHAHKFEIDGNKMIISVVRDITEREATRKKLEASNTRFRKLSKMSTQGILIHKKFQVMDCNLRLCEILEMTQEDLIGQNFLFNVLKTDLNKIKKYHDKNIPEAYEISIITKNNKVKTIEALNKTIEWEGQEANVLTINDISVRKQFETELIKSKQDVEEALMTRDSFISNMGHEIRTPLNAIIGFSELIMSKLKDKKLQEQVNTINKNGIKLKKLISFLFETTKLHTGQIKIKNESTNVGFLLTDLFNRAKVEENKKITKKIEVSDNFHTSLYIDPLKLRQAVNHIIDNAFKFTNEGNVTLSLKTEEDQQNKINLVIQIKDTGIGIKKEFLPKAFEYFRQQEQNDKKAYEGTGIGLAMAKQLIELLGGKIFIESELNKGTNVTIYISKIEKSDPTKQPGPEATESKVVNKSIIEFVKHSYVIDRFNFQLSSLGYKIIESHSIKEFEEFSRIENTEIIFVDSPIYQKHHKRINSILQAFPKIIKVFLNTNATFDDEIRNIFTLVIDEATELNELTNLINKENSHEDENKPIHLISSKANQNDITIIEPALGLLNRLCIPVWSLLNQRISIKTLDEFISLLKSIHSKYPISELENYIESITEYRELFDVTKISEILKTFPSLLNILKDSTK